MTTFFGFLFVWAFGAIIAANIFVHLSLNREYKNQTQLFLSCMLWPITWSMILYYWIRVKFGYK